MIWVLFKKSLLVTMSSSLFPTFSYIRVEISGFILIHLELSFETVCLKPVQALAKTNPSMESGLGHTITSLVKKLLETDSFWEREREAVFSKSATYGKSPHSR